MGLSRRAFAASSLATLATATRGATPGPGSAAADPSPPVDAALFGMHFHRLVPESGGPQLRTRWPEAGVGAVRLWDSGTRWADLAPARERWNFDRLDAYVAQAEAHGASLLYTLGSTPRWASARPDEPGPYGPGCAAEPRSMDDWAGYLRTVAGRYRHRIGAWELWNEPYFSDFAADRDQPGAFFTGSVATMVEMGRIAREVIGAVAPGALLVSPGFVGGLHRIDRWLAQGGAASVDVLAYHFYCENAGQFAAEAAGLRRTLAERGAARLPLWNTEWGVDHRPRPEVEAGMAGPVGDAAEARAALVVQFLVVAAASGIARAYYHAWDNDHTGMADGSGAAAAHRRAYEQARRWLGGCRVGPLRRFGAAAMRVDATAAAGERRLFVWSDRAERARLPLDAGWRLAAVEGVAGVPSFSVVDSPATVVVDLGRSPLCVRLAARAT